ncbi:MAG: polyprenyl synthetase family protein [Blastochloris viridis]|uniref:Probable farnesyl diphosphate synthase n=1 Tax=Blastochloris viridis TaxID=1079 RepID=A0A6N4R326_BLAVI|nr:MAG: polyprenyl synthetase family protein [Blastochloris viridis]
MNSHLILNDAEQQVLQTELKAISGKVEECLDNWLPTLQSQHGDRVLECMRYSTFAGGKRLRPALVIAASRLGRYEGDGAYWVGSAMEMIHTYSLIQDDLPSLDNDDLRRGRPTAHKQFDEATAILASDGLQTGAYELLTRERVHKDPLVRLEIIRLFARSSGSIGMVLGQMVDMQWEWDKPTNLGVDDLARMNYLKTGMNITACCEAGVVLAAAAHTPDHDLRLRMVRFGDAIGRAFQVYDDVLDVTGTAEVLGKTPGKDAKAGKTTFVSLLGLEGAQKRAVEECERALAEIQDFGPEADLLRLIARYCVTRDK